MSNQTKPTDEAARRERVQASQEARAVYAAQAQLDLERRQQQAERDARVAASRNRS